VKTIIYCILIWLISIGLIYPREVDETTAYYSESVFIMDNSSSMMTIYGSGKQRILDNIICYIQNAIMRLPNGNQRVTIIVFAESVNMKTWEKLDNSLKSDIFTYLETIRETTLNEWQENPDRLAASYITSAILNGYGSLRHDPTETEQEINLFSDGELLFPKNVKNPISFSQLKTELSSYNINPFDRRKFNFYPILVKPKEELRELSSREGGEIVDIMEINHCDPLRRISYDSYRILITVMDESRHLFPGVRIEAPFLRNFRYSDSSGRALFQVHTPQDFWYPFIFKHTGYDSSLTHAHIAIGIEPGDTIQLVSIMLTRCPLELTFNIIDSAKSFIPDCSLYIQSPLRQRTYLIPTMPWTIKYYDYSHEIDSIGIRVRHPSYFPRQLPLKFKKETNQYQLNIEMERIKV